MTISTEYDPPVIVVSGKLLGQVVDDAGTVVPSALVRVGNNSTVTNEFGLFQFDNIQMNASGTYITASRDGYFLGSDRIYPANGSTNFSRIQLLTKTLAGTITNAQGGDIQLAGANIRFEPNTIVNQQGTVVDGDISVYAQWLDPTAEDLGDFMPGALFGLNADGQEVTMTSMGMLAVELFDADGNELNIAAGREATLQFSVPASLLSIAPSEIPLWFFDEADGLWIEEGVATLDGDTYTGKVSHFTFWNVDFPYGTETVDISGCVKFENGDPAVFYDFTVAVEGGGIIVRGRTDNDGNFYGPVPLNETLVFQFTDECGGTQEFTVGPFTEDTDLVGCLILTPENGEATLSGQLVDCEGEGVSDGVVILQGAWPWNVISTDEDGNFSATCPFCGSSFDVIYQGFDLNNNNQTDEQTVTVGGDVDLGPVTICDNPIDEFIDASTNGVDQFFIDVELYMDSIQIDSLTWELGYSLIGNGTDQDQRFHRVGFSLLDIAVGTYTGDDLGFYYWIEGQPSFALGCPVSCNTIDVNITANGGPGGYLEGNYDGTSDGQDNQGPITDRPVSGTFRVQIPQ